MTLLAVGLSLLALLVALVAAWRVQRLSEPVIPPDIPPYDDTELRDGLAWAQERFTGLSEAYAETTRWKSDIELAVDQGIKHVDRVENRIRSTVRRARESMAEHGYESPGLDAEAAELRELDGTGGGDGAVPAVPQDVAPTGDRYAGIPGTVSDDDFVRLW